MRVKEIVTIKYAQVVKSDDEVYSSILLVTSR